MATNFQILPDSSGFSQFPQLHFAFCLTKVFSYSNLYGVIFERSLPAVSGLFLIDRSLSFLASAGYSRYIYLL